IFITTLPVRVDVDDRAELLPWLRALQAAQAEARRFEHVPLTRLHACSGVPSGVNLFDSIVVFENYPIDDAAGRGVGLRDLWAVETTNYPISLMVSPGSRLAFDLEYDPTLFDAETVRRLAGHLLALLEQIAA